MVNKQDLYSGVRGTHQANNFSPKFAQKSWLDELYIRMYAYRTVVNL